MAEQPRVPPPEGAEGEGQAHFWRANLRLVATLMAIGFLVTFVGGYFAGDFSGWQLFGWPLPFLMAAHGSLVIYVAIVCIYAWRAHAIEKRLAASDAPR
jgi:putative solute:sodium symporter small subunit